ncbi:5-carboxymethyl-2-hydroxymuconate isomerase [Hydrogenophaga sp. BPS33]|uniref:5-carboxymethyl-2-hydroxymuconate isomerase n=1 Tax=Hydrogenophaga sp. BPS33 TaxID=2651974 RepID=UPI00131FE0DB|nr:5-carboxymethyl-2-hydroxymuconate isomerase [Hydrogenophaga sp. BPS33]QHE83787.1 5-carboxymethyl-2-hydroxymuconate isomerase [Hydrogenophaga sp. BPS33]
MPHLVILYTPNLDRTASEGGTDMDALCRTLCDAMLAVRDEADKQVFPTGGTRVLAYPAAHSAVGDGGAAGIAAGLGGEYAFVYMNVRMAKGRSTVVHQRVGEALQAVVKAHFATQLATRPIGITVQVDEGHEVFDSKTSSLHPLFNKG